MRSWSTSTQSDTPISCPASDATVSKVAVFISISCGFVGEDAYLTLQIAQRPVLDPESGQMFHRAVEIFAVGAEHALRLRDPACGIALVQGALVTRMRAVDHEGQHAIALEPVDVGVEPARLVGAGNHFTQPQNREFAFDRIRGDAMGDAGARAAAIHPEHEAWFFRRAASDAECQTEGAMIAAYMRFAAVDDIDRRIPHQRAIAEHPGILALRNGSEHRLQRGAARFFRHERNTAAFGGGIRDASHPLEGKVLAPQIPPERLRGKGLFLLNFVRQSVTRVCPNSDRGSAACRACPWDGAAARDRN